MSRSIPSIRQKLQLSFTLTLGLAIIVMGSIWIRDDHSLLENEAKMALSARAEVIGMAAKPALLFSDGRLADKLLRTLKADKDIVQLRLFTADGQVLASLNVASAARKSIQPVPFKTEGFHITKNSMELYAPIRSKGRLIGVAYVESSLQALSESEHTSVLTISLVMASSLILALIIALGLQRKITGPIVSLANLMRRAADNQDYSLHHPESSGIREINDLLSGYNAMTDKVEEGFITIENSQRQLRDSEKRFRLIAEAAPLPVIISRQDGQGGVLFINKAASQLLGVDQHPPGTLTGTAMLYHHSEDRQKVLNIVSTQGELNAYELPLRKLDGSKIWVELSIVPIEFEDEKGWFGAFVDITERRLVQQTLADVNAELEKRVLDRTLALQETNEKLLSSQQETIQAHDELQWTLDNMLDTYYRISTNGRLIWASKSAQSLLGYNAEELESMYVEQIFADKRALRAFRIAFAKSNGTLTNFETRLQHRDGNLIWISASANLFRKPGKDQGEVEGVVRDITAQVEAEEEKAEMERHMAHVQRLESLGVLAGGIAHDFNNLLSAILGNAELVNLKVGAHSPVTKEVGSIVTSCERAADLCRQMLAYSGQGRIAIESINLSDLVEETAQLLDVFVSKKATIAMNLQTELPIMEGDKTQIRQIIMNLITNASEAIGENTGEISISTHSFEAKASDLRSEYIENIPTPGYYVCFEVIDTGCGMNKATLQRIFDPFFSTKFTGRGLGMSAVLGIVRSHHGSIRINSRPKKGTAIRVLFPVSPIQSKEILPLPNMEGPTSASIDQDDTAMVTILLVDDEHMVRATTEAVLKRMGYKVLSAANGHECIEIFHQFHKDIAVVILDLTMPVMDGRETFQQLCHIDAEVKVILSSGYSREEVLQRFADMPPAGFLQKPYQSALLQQSLRKIIQRT